MKKVFVSVVLLFTCFPAFSVDYINAKITGVGLFNTDNFIRFTIDKEPNAIFTTKNFSGEQHDRLVSLIIAAYAAQSPVAFVRSSESESVASSTKHYTEVLILEVGNIVHN